MVTTKSDVTSQFERLLPVALRLTGRTCLVVGAGRVGTHKVAALRAAHATVHVVAPSATEELRRRCEDDALVRWSAREFCDRDLDGAFVVFTATGISDVDGGVFEAATSRGLWVNSADDPEHCSLYLTSVVRREPVTVSISTSGASPALASYLRQRLDHILEVELGDLAVLLSDRRSELRAEGRSTELVEWDGVVNDELVALVAANDWDEVRRRIATIGAVSP